MAFSNRDKVHFLWSVILFFTALGLLILGLSNLGHVVYIDPNTATDALSATVLVLKVMMPLGMFECMFLAFAYILAQHGWKHLPSTWKQRIEKQTNLKHRILLLGMILVGSFLLLYCFHLLQWSIAYISTAKLPNMHSPAGHILGIFGFVVWSLFRFLYENFFVLDEIFVSILLFLILLEAKTIKRTPPTTSPMVSPPLEINRVSPASPQPSMSQWLLALPLICITTVVGALFLFLTAFHFMSTLLPGLYNRENFEPLYFTTLTILGVLTFVIVRIMNTKK